MHAVDTASARHARPTPGALPAGQRIADMLARVRCDRVSSAACRVT